MIDNHMSVLFSFGISFSKEDFDLPSLYWIFKRQESPYKQSFIFPKKNMLCLIHKNSNERLESLRSKSLTTCQNLKTFDFSITVPTLSWKKD